MDTGRQQVPRLGVALRGKNYNKACVKKQLMLWYNFITRRNTRRLQTSTESADRAEFLLSLSYIGTNSLIRFVIRITTKIDRFVASETSRSPKKFIRIRRQLRELYVLPLSHNGEKIPLKFLPPLQNSSKCIANFLR